MPCRRADKLYGTESGSAGKDLRGPASPGSTPAWSGPWRRRTTQILPRRPRLRTVELVRPSARHKENGSPNRLLSSPEAPACHRKPFCADKPDREVQPVVVGHSSLTAFTQHSREQVLGTTKPRLREPDVRRIVL